MKKERLNLDREYGELTTSSKKVWDNAVEEIEEMAEELNLTQEQKEAYLHKSMAEIRYADLKAVNEYLSRSQDEFAVRAIKKNKLDMQRLKASHAEICDEVKDFDARAQQEILNNRNQNEREKTQERKAA